MKTATPTAATKQQANLNRWQAELANLEHHIIHRWGDCRRFHSNARKHARRNWLIEHIATAKTTPQGTAQRITQPIAQP